MADHPLVAATKRGTAAPDAPLRAQADAEAVEALLTEATALTTATDESRARFLDLVHLIDTFTREYRTNHATKELAAWYQGVTRRLYATAVALGVAQQVARPLEALQPGQPILPSVARPRDLRWMHGLR